MASASIEYNSIWIWDINTGELVHTLEEHTQGVNVISYSPDDGIIASGSQDNSIILWDTKTNAIRHKLKAHTDSINNLLFRPDGQVIVSTSDDNTIRLWDVTTGTLIYTLRHTDEKSTSNLAYTSDGKYLFTLIGKLWIWDVSFDKLGLYRLDYHHDNAKELICSPDGKILASAHTDAVVLWDIRTGNILHILEHKDTPKLLNLYNIPEPYDKIRMAYHPDGKVIATGLSDNKVYTWDVITGQCLYIRNNIEGYLAILMYDDKERLIAISNSEDVSYMWDVEAGKILHSTESVGNTKLCVYVKKLNAIIYEKNSFLIRHIFDSELYEEEYIGYKCGTIAYNNMNNLLATAESLDNIILRPIGASFSSRLIIWNINTSDSIAIDDYRGEITTLTFSPNGKVLASGFTNGMVKLWDTSTGNLLYTLQSQLKAITALAYNPDGKSLFSASEDGSIRIWDMNSSVFRLLYDFEPDEVLQVFEKLWGHEIDYNTPVSTIMKNRSHSNIRNPNSPIGTHSATENPPNPGETRLAQIVRFLEEKKAYRRKPLIDKFTVNFSIRSEL